MCAWGRGQPMHSAAETAWLNTTIESIAGAAAAASGVPVLQQALAVVGLSLELALLLGHLKLQELLRGDCGGSSRKCRRRQRWEVSRARGVCVSSTGDQVSRSSLVAALAWAQHNTAAHTCIRRSGRDLTVHVGGARLLGGRGLLLLLVQLVGLLGGVVGGLRAARKGNNRIERKAVPL